VVARRTARPRAQIDFATRLVSRSFDEPLLRGPEVDLYGLAGARGIRRLEFCPLLADGRLLVMADGFTVQLNDPERAVVTIGSSSRRRLTRKQRFTLAHEIAHTLVYDLACSPPLEMPQILSLIDELRGRERASGLEDFCQIAAGVLLVSPKDLKREAGRGGVASVESLLRLADTFKVSAEVLIHRVAQTTEDEGIRANNYAVLMVAPERGKGQIRACIYSPSLRCAVTPPRLYTSFKHWAKRNSLSSAILTATGGNWEVRVPSGFLKIQKTPYGTTPGAWLLDMTLVQ